MAGLEIDDKGMCFVCGRRNRDGLGLLFDYDGHEVSTTVVFPAKFQGYDGIVHGGLISTVLDEAMVTLLNRSGELAMTAELTVRFLSPARVGEPIRVTAKLAQERRKIRRLEAFASREDGSEIARATATFVRMSSLAAGRI